VREVLPRSKGGVKLLSQLLLLRRARFRYSPELRSLPREKLVDSLKDDWRKCMRVEL
jgi:hypothetical protein